MLLGSAESLFLASLAHACSLDIARQHLHLESVPKQLPSDLLAEHPCAADDEDRFYAHSGSLGLVLRAFRRAQCPNSRERERHQAGHQPR
jgi:hypothetical protein